MSASREGPHTVLVSLALLVSASTGAGESCLRDSPRLSWRRARACHARARNNQSDRSISLVSVAAICSAALASARKSQDIMLIGGDLVEVSTEQPRHALPTGSPAHRGTMSGVQEIRWAGLVWRAVCRGASYPNGYVG